jgi:hypothetical protein
VNTNVRLGSQQTDLRCAVGAIQPCERKKACAPDIKFDLFCGLKLRLSEQWTWKGRLRSCGTTKET